jgi:hypothetical protein
MDSHQMAATRKPTDRASLGLMRASGQTHPMVLAAS